VVKRNCHKANYVLFNGAEIWKCEQCGKSLCEAEVMVELTLLRKSVEQGWYSVERDSREGNVNE
jgi:ribosomal protein L37AE/L43A